MLPDLARSGGNTAVMLGLAVSAYPLGVRHAFDADHIVAIGPILEGDLSLVLLSAVLPARDRTDTSLERRS